jgi:hypothetical protein
VSLGLGLLSLYLGLGLLSLYLGLDVLYSIYENPVDIWTFWHTLHRDAVKLRFCSKERRGP